MRRSGVRIPSAPPDGNPVRPDTARGRAGFRRWSRGAGIGPRPPVRRGGTAGHAPTDGQPAAPPAHPRSAGPPRGAFVRPWEHPAVAVRAWGLLVQTRGRHMPGIARALTGRSGSPVTLTPSPGYGVAAARSPCRAVLPATAHSTAFTVVRADPRNAPGRSGMRPGSGQDAPERSQPLTWVRVRRTRAARATAAVRVRPGVASRPRSTVWCGGEAALPLPRPPARTRPHRVTSS